MSLATRCTSCATVFRVVQDQLKVSEGWVRCGRCDAVFNAFEGLFDLGREAPPDWEDPGEVAGRSAALAEDAAAGAVAARGDAARNDEGTPSALEEVFADPVDAHLFGPRKRADSAPKPAGKVGARDRLEFSDARFDSDLFAENASGHGGAEELTASEAGALPLESTVRPDFLRRADRRARWRSGPARIAIGAGSVVAAVALMLQIGHHYRDALAANWPALRPALASLCVAASCSIELARRIDDGNDRLGVMVENSALTRLPSLDGFVLSVNLRNRGAVPLALPSIDLNLTDSNGRLVARRALSPRDFRAPEVLQAGAEAALQLTLGTGSAAIAGYTVVIFYP